MTAKKQTSKRASKPRPKDLPLAAAKSGCIKGGR
jgi:hypothetical protein